MQSDRRHAIYSRDGSTLVSFSRKRRGKATPSVLAWRGRPDFAEFCAILLASLRADCAKPSQSHVQAVTHFLARLKIRNAFGVDFDGRARARIAAGAAVPCASRKRAEATEFDATATSELFHDLIEEAPDDVFNIAQREARVFLGKDGNEFGSNQGSSPLARSRNW